MPAWPETLACANGPGEGWRQMSSLGGEALAACCSPGTGRGMCAGVEVERDRAAEPARGVCDAVVVGRVVIMTQVFAAGCGRRGLGKES